MLFLISACSMFAMEEPTAPAPEGLYSWSVGPRTLRLLDEDRAVVVEDGAALQELEIPTIGTELRDAAVATVDLDFDGNPDLRIVDLDSSGAYNVFHAFYRFDPSTTRFERCTALDELHNVVVDPLTRRVTSTSLGNGMGSSGTKVILESRGGCAFHTVATLTWDVPMESGEGFAWCEVDGTERWRVPMTDQLPERPCP